MHIDPTLMPLNPVDYIIGVIYLLIFGITYYERFRTFVIILQIFVLLLKVYKHIGPMVKHYFDTHPAGQQLKRKTTLDNKVNYLIRTHKLPYDSERRHDELQDQGAEG